MVFDIVGPMPETTPDYNPERGLPTVRFGDVVRCGSHSPDHHIMITDVDESHHHNGIALIDPDSNRYGMPGTIPPGQILEVVDHIPHEEAIEILVHSLGEPMRSRILDHYQD